MSHQLEGKTEALYIGSGPLIKAVDDVKSFVKASRYILSDFLFKDDYKTETIGDDLVTITNRDGFDVAAAEPNLGFVLVDSDPACCGDVFGNYLKLPSGLL
ncbi:hypothetical protein KY328_05940, partial [Candidatus Woesearchaeota archaeon]|nr:hypothetical protein [Candidatus Woesearchaeota archaeon]